MPAEYHTSGHKLVSNGDTLFYINTVDNVFLQLTCTESLADCHWNILADTADTLAPKLQIPRKSPFLTMIPSHLTECN